MSVEDQTGVEGSTLEMYRRALHVRRESDALGEGPMEWLDAPEGVLAVRRLGTEGDVTAILNLTPDIVRLPGSWGSEVLVASGDNIAVLDDDGAEQLVIGGETALWLAE